MNKKCRNCDAKLTTFIGYIPGVGESCMDCYIEYQIRDENRAKTPATSKKASTPNASPEVGQIAQVYI